MVKLTYAVGCFNIRGVTKSQDKKAFPKRGRAPRVASTETSAPVEGPRTSYTSFVVFPDQLAALKLTAVRLQARHGGKADQSAVLRAALDAIATGGELPEGLRDALAEGLRQRKRMG